MTSTAALWDRIADGYAAKPISDMAAYEHTLARTAAYLGASDRVLELGCGTGTTALKLAPSVGEILATDISPRMIAIAEEKARAAGTATVRFAVADADHPDLAAGSWDAVAAFNLIHLFDDIPATLARIHALLKPGGVFVSKSACIGGAWQVLMPLIWALRLVGRAPHVTALTPDTLDRLIRDAGFEIVETGIFPKRPPARFVVARKV